MLPIPLLFNVPSSGGCLSGAMDAELYTLFHGADRGGEARSDFREKKLPSAKLVSNLDPAVTDTMASGETSSKLIMHQNAT